MKYPRRSYGLLMTGNFLWVFAFNLYFYFIGLYVRGLGADPVGVGSYSAVLSLSALIWIGVGGLLTQRLGEKPVIIMSWVGVVPAPFIYLLAPSWQWTLLAAVCEGTGALAAAPVGSYVSRVVSHKRRGLGYTLIMSSSTLGGIPGPLIGGFIISHYGYHPVFLLAATLYLTSTLVVMFISPAPRPPSLKKTGKGERRNGWSFLCSGVFLTSTLLQATVITLYSVAFFFVPLFLADRFGLGEGEIGLLGTVVNASASLMAPLLGLAGDRWGHTKIVVLPVIGYFGFFWLLLLCPSPLFLPWVYAFHGLAFGLYTLLSATISRHLPQDQLPSAFAAFAFASRLLSPLAPLMGGVGYALNPSIPLLAAGLLLPLPLVLTLLLHQQTRKWSRAAACDRPACLSASPKEG